MTIIQIKGPIVSSNEKWFYDWLGMEATSPADIVLPDTGEPIEVHINSGGGSVYAGSEIYTALKDYPGEVVVKVVGIAASAASVIAMAGDVVEISPTAQIMIHNVSAIVQGDDRKLLKESEVLKNYNTSIANAYVLKTGKSMEELLALMSSETWFTADSAVAHGFADKVMFANEAPPLVASLSVAIPSDIIDRMANRLKPPTIDTDKIVAEVVERLNTIEKETVAKETPCQGLGRFLF